MLVVSEPQITTFPGVNPLGIFTSQVNTPWPEATTAELPNDGWRVAIPPALPVYVPTE